MQNTIDLQLRFFDVVAEKQSFQNQGLQFLGCIDLDLVFFQEFEEVYKLFDGTSLFFFDQQVHNIFLKTVVVELGEILTGGHVEPLL